MTRADEIVNEFETPFPGRAQLRRDSPPLTLKTSSTTAEVAPSEDTTPSLGRARPSDHPHIPQSRLGRPRSSAALTAADEDDQALNSESQMPPDSQTANRPAARETPRGVVVDDVPGEDLDPGLQPQRKPGAAHEDRLPRAAQHESLPQLARAAAGGILQAAGWTAGTSLRVSNQLRKLAVDPASAQDVIDEVTREVRDVARDFLGVTELEAEVKEMAPLLSSGLLRAGGASPAALRAQGEALLRAAADVGFDESAHPAFARILTELSPDEARILRLLAIEGAQPMVDIRASNLIGNGSQLIAQSLTMLGPKAGLRQRDRVLVYLTNLVRLNLVDLSNDSLDRPLEYQVLEAQPDVLALLRDTVRAKTIRRNVGLTPLGNEFCEVCLPVNLPALPPPRNGT